MYKLFFYQYKFPFKNPSLRIYKEDYREGLYIELRNLSNKNELSLWAECSPFPYNIENRPVLIQHIKELMNFSFSLKEQNLGLIEILVNLYLFTDKNNYYRESLFAVESLILGLFRKYDLTNFIFTEREEVILEMNALIDTSLDNLKMEVLYLLDCGYDTFKVKTKNDGDTNAINIATIMQIRSLIGKDRTLRLDANQSFTLPEAIKFVKQIAHCNIEYIEEPLISPVQNMTAPYLKPSSESIIPHIDNLEKFYKKTGVHYALDESTRNYQVVFSNSNYKGLKALVLKASRLGIWRTIQLKQEAEKRSIITTLSCPFETEVAFYPVLCFLADEKKSIGYDVIRWLDTSTVIHNSLNKGTADLSINVNQWLNNSNFINTNYLYKIED